MRSDDVLDTRHRLLLTSFYERRATGSDALGQSRAEQDVDLPANSDRAVKSAF